MMTMDEKKIVCTFGLIPLCDGDCENCEWSEVVDDGET